MGPMLVLAGLAVGWASEAIRHAGGHGFLADLGVALVGSIIAGGIVWGGISPGLGMVAMFAIGCAGGAMAIIAQRWLWPSRRGGDSERGPGARSAVRRSG